MRAPHQRPALTAEPEAVQVLRASVDETAAEYLDRRWRRCRAVRYDYEATARALLEEGRFGPEDEVLEIGCGPGTWTREIAARAKRVIALDLSEKRIDLAREYTRGLPVEFICGDFATAQIPGRFDKVVSVRALEYMPDLYHVASRVASVVRERGSTVLITKTRYSIWRGRMLLLYGWHRFLRRSAGASVRQYLRAPGEIEAAFGRFGHTVRSVRPIAPRPPIFRGGFHEYPAIPDAIAPPFLWLPKVLCPSGGTSPAFARNLSMWFSESYCVTLQMGNGGKECTESA